MSSPEVNIEVVQPILEAAGDTLLTSFGMPTDVRSKSISPADLVTQQDQVAEEFIARELRRHYPDIPLVGEEYGGDSAVETFWLLDPIDGTAHYVRGNEYCTTMLTLIHAGEPVFVAIYDFIRKKMYSARKGAGALCNGDPISVSERSLAEAYLAYEVNMNIPENLEAWRAINQRCVLTNTISSGYEYAAVASGKLDGRICFNPFGGLYDYAPGALLVAEAGGVVRNLGADSYDYTNFSFIAVNPIIYDELMAADLLPTTKGIV